jgi:ABC-type transport system involved in multi-copper enzyme maturation permease subunit
MTWVVWRQYRLPGAFALALLAAFAAAELTTGFQMAAAWHSLLQQCQGTVGQQQDPGGPCSGGSIVGVLGNDLRVLSVLAPALIGILIGAPLVAYELESGTAGFAWTQGITRGRWFLAKAGWLLLASAVLAGAVAAFVTFWSGPVNAMRGSQFSANYFDTQGIVPVGYAVFAAALGIAAGALLRRTLPAIVVTLGVFIGVRILFDNMIRAHLMPAVTTLTSMTSTWSPPGIAWFLDVSVVGPSGQAFSSDLGFYGYPLTAACARLTPASSAGPVPDSVINAALSCMQRAGYRQASAYQPGWRYWPFQGIETGIYLLLAAALVAGAWYLLRRRDA